MAKGIKQKRLTEVIRGKLIATLAVIICLFLLLIGRMIYWNIKNGKEYSNTVLTQQTYSSEDILAERGNIYDRNGKILASNERRYRIILEPANILLGNEKQKTNQLEATLKTLFDYFDIDKYYDGEKLTEEKLTELIKDNENSTQKYYLPINTYCDFKQLEAYNEFMELADLSVKNEKDEEKKIKITLAKNVCGITFEEEYVRYYPYGSSACSVIGFTSDNSTGKYGLENSYNSVLNGTNGRKYTYFDERLEKEQTIKKATNGNSIVSTIDIQIQKVIEEKLKEFDERIGSDETSILVMDPNNGEILGMANSDPFDLNDAMDTEKYLPLKYSDKEIAKYEQNTKDYYGLFKTQEYLDENIKDYSKLFRSLLELVQTYEKDKSPGDDTLKERVEELLDEKSELSEKKKEKLSELYDEIENLITVSKAMNQVWMNPIVTDTHEPGSTYKPFTVAAGLESGKLTGGSKDVYYCTGSKNVGSQSVSCSHEHGKVNLKNALAKSCNVAMMNIAFKEGIDKFYYYQSLFGFGQHTGIDLPGEPDTSNLVYTTDDFSDKEQKINESLTLATNSFGQNFNCTMLQMASGFCALINGGNYYTPHIVKQIKNDQGDIVETKSKNLLRKIVSESTSKKLRSYLKETVVSGTGTKAKLEGYVVGGKTGTAEKLGRNKEDYYISFIGFTSVSNPELLIYVTIDKPKVDDQANSTALAVGLEQACMAEIVDILGIQPTEEIKSSDENDGKNYIDIYLENHKKPEKKTTKKATTEKKKTTDKATTEKKKTTDKATTEKKKTTDKATTEKKKTTDKATTEKKKTTKKATTEKSTD